MNVQPRWFNPSHGPQWNTWVSKTDDRKVYFVFFFYVSVKNRHCVIRVKLHKSESKESPCTLPRLSRVNLLHKEFMWEKYVKNAHTKLWDIHFLTSMIVKRNSGRCTWASARTTSAVHNLEPRNAESMLLVWASTRKQIKFYFFIIMGDKKPVKVTWYGFFRSMRADSDISAFTFVYVSFLFQFIKHNNKKHIIQISKTAAWTAVHYLSPQPLSFTYSNEK